VLPAELQLELHALQLTALLLATCHVVVSYYALFQGWLLLGKPPGCQSTLTSFAT
jgi:hypothetical protein